MIPVLAPTRGERSLLLSRAERRTEELQSLRFTSVEPTIAGSADARRHHASVFPPFIHLSESPGITPSPQFHPSSVQTHAQTLLDEKVEQTEKGGGGRQRKSGLSCGVQQQQQQLSDTENTFQQTRRECRGEGPPEGEATPTAANHSSAMMSPTHWHKGRRRRRARGGERAEGRSS